MIPRAIVRCVMLCLSFGSVFGQEGLVTPGDSIFVKKLDELQAIEFVGCEETTPEQLLGVIQSRESEFSLTRSLALYYWKNLRVNPATPDAAMKTLNDVQEELSEELRYFDLETVQADSASLLVYLSQNGFHNARVTWSAGRERDTKKFTLTFEIHEGRRAVIDTLIYLGLNDLDSAVRSWVDGVMVVHDGDPFSEESIDRNAQEIITLLQNSGYYRSTYSTPHVWISEDGLHDSVLVEFDPGPRARIGKIVFEENLNGYPTVNESTRRRQLEFKVGDWFSRRKLNQSRFNLMELGVFDVVSVDTVDVAQSELNGDSLVTIKVFTKNSKNYDAGANLLMYQTQVDNYLNVGAGITGEYRNVFNGAQKASVTLQYILQDISSVVQGQNLQSEALANGVFAWPNIARVEGLRVGLSTNLYYSLRLLYDPFRLESIGLSTRAPFNLYSHTFFNGFDVNFSLERQIPKNYENALDSALRNANNATDSAYVYSTFNQFQVLNKYLHDTTTGESHFLTGIFAGVNFRGEHLNNRIDPSSGTFTSVSGEFGWGAGRFLKMQVYQTTANRLSPSFVLATKVRFGHIQLFQFERGSDVDTNTYVPLERQFFAGGAASIRSYPSRSLHDPNSGVIATEDPSQQDILNNVVGSGSLMELSVELRWRMQKPRRWTGLLATAAERSGITTFIDIGNSFNRLTPDLYGSMRLEDLYKGSVVAFGLGYRFDTPVGPFRIDYATSIYDPLRDTGRVIWNGRQNIFGTENWTLSFGLGHAF